MRFYVVCRWTCLVFGMWFLSGVIAQPYNYIEPYELTDFQVYPINGVDQIEPSGLTLKEGVLYTVGDKHNAIYRLDIVGQEAWLSKAVALNSELYLGVSELDLEGITTVDGDFVVVSETHHRLIHVYDDGLRWLPEQGNDLYQSAYEAGLLQLYNAGLEALVYLGEQRFLVAAERQPRGLIALKFNHDLSKIEYQTNQIMINSRQKLYNRHPDLAGLYLHDQQVFGLQRNAYVVHQLNRLKNGQYVEGQAWSYEHIVRDSKYAYSDMQFGHAEGLAVDDENFYLVLDNNLVGNAKNPNDNRPLLIVAKRPMLDSGD